MIPKPPSHHLFTFSLPCPYCIFFSCRETFSSTYTTSPWREQLQYGLCFNLGRDFFFYLHGHISILLNGSSTRMHRLYETIRRLNQVFFFMQCIYMLSLFIYWFFFYLHIYLCCIGMHARAYRCRSRSAVLELFSLCMCAYARYVYIPFQSIYPSIFTCIKASTY